MRCIHCGLPLSPNNTYKNCPRCNMALVPEPQPVVNHSPQAYNNQVWSGTQRGTSGSSWGQEQAQPQQSFSTSSPQWPISSSSPQWPINTPQDQVPFPPASQQLPFSPSGLNWQAAPNPSQLSTPEPMPSQAYGNSAPYMASPRAAGAMSSAQMTGMRPQAPRSSNIGFVVAGLCVFAGALILIFVYFMGLGLPSNSSTNATYPSTGITATPNANTNPPTAVATAPTVAPSPTVTGNPGAQYIDNPQMASSVNVNTAQPLQVTTTFKPQQKIYVTFNLHPNGKFGAVCLYWYLNNKYITQYPFPVTPNDKAGYSYAIYGGVGPASVEIFWASSTACSDKVLAQQVNFTVTA